MSGEFVGDSTLKITGAASLGEAAQGEISFFTNRKYVGLLRDPAHHGNFCSRQNF